MFHQLNIFKKCKHDQWGLIGKLIVYSSAGMSNLKTFFTGKKVVDLSKKNRMIKKFFKITTQSHSGGMR